MITDRSDFLSFLRTDSYGKSPGRPTIRGSALRGAHPLTTAVRPTSADVPTPQPTGESTQPITENYTAE